MVDTRSNLQLSELNSKPHGGQSLRDIIYHVIGTHLYPTTGSGHHTLPHLDKFHGPTHFRLRLTLQKT